MTTSNNTIATNMSATTSKKITKQIVQQQLIVDKERPSCTPQSTETSDAYLTAPTSATSLMATKLPLLYRARPTMRALMFSRTAWAK